MECVLAIFFAKFIQFHLRNAAHSANFCSIVTSAALGAFHPEMFSFSFFCHLIFTYTALKTTNNNYCLVAIFMHSIKFFKGGQLSYDANRPWLIFYTELWIITNPAFCCLYCNYSRILVTTPAPTVRPPSRIAKRTPSSIAIGLMISPRMRALSPGIHISAPP